ncbi:hypothetical protein QH494_19000 [Sphingomonas sp. AR_OL41]|uniref:hypothetical protein n=1 Tax=Sphingomonas sp. AR_OL41 TaxID=3042729 RepID=UPI0024807DC0|nr:hypothetical protein [Sphingomonas sp. AR_OL41]MDH7974281.1 hypothetical protein [Sphingomonas sp. AR_OL41]
MIKAFFSNWAGAFRDSWGAARALPILLVLMIGIEGAQHVIELQLGFFSPDAAVRKAASLQPVRMAFGWPKMLILYAVGLVAMRWFVTRDAHAALRPSAMALRRYLGVVLFQLIPAVGTIYAGPIAAWLGRGPDAVATIRAVCGLSQLLIEPLLLLWFVNAAMGTTGYGPIASARTVRWYYPFALLLIFVTRMPVALLHNGFNRWAAGQPLALQGAMLACDALVVGVLALVVPAIQVRIARYIAARRGVTLLGDAVAARTAAVPQPA